MFLYITVNLLNCLSLNVCIALSLSFSVASGERSFSVLAIMKSFNRSWSTQTRVSGLATLCLKLKLVRKLNFEKLIKLFASIKARKAHL